MKIRNATHDDVEEMAYLGGLMVAESETYRHLGYNFAKVKATLHIWIDTPECICLVVESDEGKVVGGFVAQCYINWFSDSLIAGDHVWFMHPDYRGARAGALLLKEYRKRAFEMGAKLAVVGNSTGIKKERVGKIVESMGFEMVGYGFAAKEE